MADQWFYRLFGEDFGPVSRAVLDELIASEQLSGEDQLRSEDSSQWITVREHSAAQDFTPRAEEGTVVSLKSLSQAGIEMVASAKPAGDQWYYQTMGQEWGPVSFDELLQQVSAGNVGPNDSVRTGSTGKWRRAGSLGRLMAAMPFSASTNTASAPVRTATAAADDDELEFNLPQTIQPSTTAAPATSQPASASVAPTPAGSDATWYAWVGGREYGPVELSVLVDWAKAGRISARDHIKHGWNSQWTPVSTVPGLVPSAPVAPVAAPAAAAAASPVVTPAKPTVTTVTQPSVAPAAVAAKTTSPSVAVATAASAKPVAAVAAAPVETAKPAPAPAAKPEPAAPASDPMKTTDTGMSAMTSFNNSSSSLSSSMKRPSAPAKKWTPPGKGKKSSGGISFSWGFFKDIRFLGAVGGVLLIVGLYFAWSFMPESTAKFKEPYQTLAKLYEEIEDKANANPPESEWKEFGPKFVEKLKPVKDKLNDMKSSQHPAKGKLGSVIGYLSMQAKKPKPEEAVTGLKSAKKALDDAGKMIGVSS